MQAIRTRYFGPTNVRGSRIQAKCEARTIYVSYDHALGIEENHVAARERLLDLLGWHGPMVCGVFDNDYCHVFVGK